MERESLSRMTSKKIKTTRKLHVTVQKCVWTSFCAAVICLVLFSPARLGNKGSSEFWEGGKRPLCSNSKYRRGLTTAARSVRQATGSFEENNSASCDGSRVYMYELPAKFNERLVAACKNGIVWWLDICQYFENGGFGAKIHVDSGDGEDEWADWYGTDSYMLEAIFYSRMQDYPCRTSNPSRADAFFIPWFGGVDALPWLYEKNITLPKRGRFGEEILEWLETDTSSKKWWDRYGGRDHFAVLGRTVWDFLPDDENLDQWGTGFLTLPRTQNMTSLMLEAREMWFGNERAIPYPTSFHPSSSASLCRWIQKVRTAKRDHLVAYVGAPRPKVGSGVRGIVESQCADSSAPGECIFFNCSQVKCTHDPVPITKSLLRSDFCLQPRGDSATRRSTFDCMIAGAIPVFFHEDTAYSQYRWHLPGDHDSYSVFIPESQVRAGFIVKNFLKSYSQEKILQMRENILSLIPKLIYNNHLNLPGGEAIDAFEVTLEGIIQRIKEYKTLQVY